MPNTEQTFALRSEGKRLRRDANYIGFMMLGLTVAMLTVYSLTVMILAFVGVFTPSQLTQDKLGLDTTTYLLFYAGIYTFAMGVPAVIISLIAKKRQFPLSPCRSVRAEDAFFGVLAAMGVCMLSNIVASVIVEFLTAHGVKEPQQPNYLEPTIESLLLNIAVFALLPALLEEMVFRGYVLRELRRYGDWFAVGVSALLFGLMHGNVAQVPFALIVGAALGWLYVMTDNIWLPVAVHFINNAFSFLLDYVGYGLDDASKGRLNAVSIFMIATIGVISVGALVIRRSALLRRLPRKTPLGYIRRIWALVTSPVFMISVAVFILLLVVESVG